MQPIVPSRAWPVQPIGSTSEATDLGGSDISVSGAMSRRKPTVTGPRTLHTAVAETQLPVCVLVHHVNKLLSQDPLVGGGRVHPSGENRPPPLRPKPAEMLE